MYTKINDHLILSTNDDIFVGYFDDDNDFIALVKVENFDVPTGIKKASKLMWEVLASKNPTPVYILVKVYSDGSENVIFASTSKQDFEFLAKNHRYYFNEPIYEYSIDEISNYAGEDHYWIRRFG